MKHMKKFGQVAVGLVGLFLQVASAAQTQIINPQKKHTFHIGRNDLTRISIEGDRVGKIYELSDGLTTQHDEQSGSLFVLPQSSDISTCHVSVVSENGKVQDLKLVVKDKPQEAIILKSQHEDNASAALQDRFFHDTSQPFEQKVLTMLQTLMQRQGDGSVMSLESYACQPLKPGVTTVCEEHFKMGSFVAEILKLHNTTQKTLPCQSDHMIQAYDVALSFPQEKLKPGQTMTAYRIRRIS